MKISSIVQKLLSNNYKKKKLVKIIKKIILKKKNKKLCYNYCFHKHLKYIYCNSMLSYIYFIPLYVTLYIMFLSPTDIFLLSVNSISVYNSIVLKNVSI